MKYYYAVLTHGITRKLDILLLTVAVALGFFGLDAWVILPESHTPLVKSLGIPGAATITTQRIQRSTHSCTARDR